MIKNIVSVGILASILVAPFSEVSQSAECKLQSVTVEGLPDTSKNRVELSGIASYGNTVYIISNELIDGEVIAQIFDRQSDQKMRFRKDVKLLNPEANDCKSEVDLEGLAVDSESAELVAIGSHSRSRKKYKPEDREVGENLEKLREYKKYDDVRCPPRHRLYLSEIENDGDLKLSERARKLRPAMEKEEVLSRFLTVPGKENGVDIEGLAYKNGKLFAGFRGPVIRHNLVPIFEFAFDGPEDEADTQFIELGGRGVRGLTAIDDGFFVLGGPVGDGDTSFQLYHWNGKSVIGGTDKPVGGKVTKLCEVPRFGVAKPEGITARKLTTGEYELLIVYDATRSFIVRRMVVWPEL